MIEGAKIMAMMEAIYTRIRHIQHLGPGNDLFPITIAINLTNKTLFESQEDEVGSAIVQSNARKCCSPRQFKL